MVARIKELTAISLQCKKYDHCNLGCSVGPKSVLTIQNIMQSIELSSNSRACIQFQLDLLQLSHLQRTISAPSWNVINYTSHLQQTELQSLIHKKLVLEDGENGAILTPGRRLISGQKVSRIIKFALCFRADIYRRDYWRT